MSLAADVRSKLHRLHWELRLPKLHRLLMTSLRLLRLLCFQLVQYLCQLRSVGLPEGKGKGKNEGKGQGPADPAGPGQALRPFPFPSKVIRHGQVPSGPVPGLSGARVFQQLSGSPRPIECHEE